MSRPAILSYPTVLVYGNIASGKSTLCAGLRKRFPQLHYVSMDDLRLQLDRTEHGMNAVAADRQCEQQLMRELATPAPVLYESSGATALFSRARMYIRGYRRGAMVLVRTTCRHSTSMHRFQHRKRHGHRQVAPPYAGRLGIVDCWWRFEDRITAVPDLLLDTDELGVADALERTVALLTQRGIG